MVNPYFLDRVAGRDANLRASDAEREATAERLRQSHAEGRIDIAEFQQRLEHCYAAKTEGELGELVRDLPRQETVRARVSRRRLLPSPWRNAPLVPVLIVLIAITAGFGHHFFWLWAALLFVWFRLSWSRRRRWSVAVRRRDGWWT